MIMFLLWFWTHSPFMFSIHGHNAPLVISNPSSSLFLALNCDVLFAIFKPPLGCDGPLVILNPPSNSDGSNCDFKPLLNHDGPLIISNPFLVMMVVYDFESFPCCDVLSFVISNPLFIFFVFNSQMWWSFCNFKPLLSRDGLFVILNPIMVVI